MVMQMGGAGKAEHVFQLTVPAGEIMQQLNSMAQGGAPGGVSSVETAQVGGGDDAALLWPGDDGAAIAAAIVAAAGSGAADGRSTDAPLFSELDPAWVRLPANPPACC